MNLRRLKGRVFITGTGRAGTTFLVQLLTDIGLDTGFERTNYTPTRNYKASASGYGTYFDSARAGLELDIFDRMNPTIVKSPYICDHVDDLLLSGIKVGKLIIPVRDIAQAAESRRFVQRETTGLNEGSSVAGGLWDTEQPTDQEQVLAMKFARLIEAAVRNDIPMTFLSFPRLVYDADYTYDKLHSLFPFTSRTTFRKLFRARADPSLVHEFANRAESR